MIQFQHLIDIDKPDIIIGTESWLHADILDSEIFSAAYKIYRRDRGSRGGGIWKSWTVTSIV